MPYYIYRIVSPKSLEPIDTKDNYKDAKQIVRTLREENKLDDSYSVRMIFAKSSAEAEKLLTLPREEGVIGED